MEILVDGLKISYHHKGSGYPVILLHGWGVDSETFMPIYEHLHKDFAVYNIDLPGFGNSEAPKEVWDIYGYADFVEKFCKELNIEKPIIIAHSFGGRISAILGSKSFAKKMILTGSAGIKPKRKPSYYIRVYSYKAAKKVMSLPLLRRYKQKALSLWIKSNPSSDYAAANGIMRQIFVKVVNQDLQHLMAKITAPTLLVWGANDTATPVADGRVMENLIPDCGLVVFENAGHYAFLQQLERFLRIVDSFLDRDKQVQ